MPRNARPVDSFRSLPCGRWLDARRTECSIRRSPHRSRESRQWQRPAWTDIRDIGVETGGSNIQFGVHPTTGRMVVIEMNPRVSRASALASKATGFPIAKIAAKLAVGYTLDEIPNDITRKTPACFEP